MAPTLGESADVDFDYGMALAHLERWNDAAAAFRSGLRQQPNQPRFMVELAGVSFKQKNYAEAQDWLERALRFLPNDEYQLDFLATVFYLEGNLEAALKYWNRVGKPQIESVSSQPTPKINPILLDRAFAFAPAGTLHLSALRTTEAQLQQLDVFSSYAFDLQARPDSHFDVVFNNAERNGCGNRWECLLMIFGESPGQILNFDYFNIGHDAINFRSSYRFDSEKRRMRAAVELPLLRPQWHLNIGADVRNENWDILPSFTGQVPLLAALNLQKRAFAAEFTDVVSGRWQWSTRTEFADRSYRNVFAGTVLNPTLLSPGPELKQSFAAKTALVRIPERRFTIDANANVDVGRLWSSNSAGGFDTGAIGNFARFRQCVRWHWYPQHSGEKYALQQTFHLGESAGRVPFDELSVLGILGDADLPMKAHIATRDGRKGSAPMGSEFFVSNWEATRQYSPQLPFPVPLQVAIGPFVDTGKITDPLTSLGVHKWVWDIGLEAKVRVLGFQVMFSYGRDLRDGHNAFVVSAP